ncbi:hypothetical protein BCR32DRAFT_327603 [Anaeromyces robustus]|uniref:Uncharacterized protein n=1 Tax=Anaeromyces robustus TaxID=1754192 RepID=A0A1Y1X4E7_9FUNG|nr:hypothetical protein BCR32DRAFT_327603 [Anaeromyces robustus]|eukprot:ORX80687.1 hypothetical protein BCR32DRAFT_327603 [Anaeromyces robustus]
MDLDNTLRLKAIWLTLLIVCLAMSIWDGFKRYSSSNSSTPDKDNKNHLTSPTTYPTTFPTTPPHPNNPPNHNDLDHSNSNSNSNSTFPTITITPSSSSSTSTSTTYNTN